MTTVANQTVGPDSVSGTVKGGVKSNAGNCAGFLGAGQRSEQMNNPGLEAGTPGGAVNPGRTTLTSVEKPRKVGG